jgi:hypothetical protein
MSSLNPQTAWRRVVRDNRLSAKKRIAALEQITRPSVDFLRGLLSSKRTPAKLRYVITQKYQIAVTRKELADRAKRSPKTSEGETPEC